MPKNIPAATVNDERLTKNATPEPVNTTDEGVTNIDGDIPDIFGHLPELPRNWPRKHERNIHAQPTEKPDYGKHSVFTAGSIEMGKAIQWQKLMAEFLRPLPITICNPRRGMWKTHSTPEANDKAFSDQVNWELDALNSVSVICFYFDRETLSPVTMLELGLWAQSGKVVCCCPDGFWKGGNIEIVCKRYGIPFVKTFPELIKKTVDMLHDKGMDSEFDLPAVPKVSPKPKNFDFSKAASEDVCEDASKKTSRGTSTISSAST